MSAYLPSAQDIFDAQYERVLEATGCQTQVELANFLGVRQSSISDAKRRHSIPSKWCMTLFEKKRINPDWILGGIGGKYLTMTNAEEMPSVVHITKIRPPQECSTQELFTELVRRSILDLDTTLPDDKRNKRSAKKS
jgi:hypothetical protein